MTLTDALLAFPIAFFMAKVAKPRTSGLLIVAVLMPLWSFYVVKVYAWRTMLSSGGVVNWALDPLGLSGPGFGTTAVWLVESYLWLPYMILPIYAGLERIPNSLLSASEDLGAGPGTTFRRVILPIAFPAVVAGSIFTFSLTLGDYIAPSTRLARHAVPRQRRLRQHHHQPAACVGGDHDPDRGDGGLPADRAPPRGLRAPMMRLSRRSQVLLRLGVGITLAFIYIPLLVIAIYAFNGGEDVGVAAAQPDHALVQRRDPR